jgi:simple sugar transport system permease protein
MMASHMRLWDIRLVRRATLTRDQSVAFTLLGLGLAFASAGVLFASVGVNPIAAYMAIAGSFTNPILLGGTIQRATPLLFAALGLVVAFRLNFWNIGAEGQLYMGAIAATGVVTLRLTTSYVPGFLVLPTMLVSSFFLGALYGLVPALLKAKLQVNEILSTLMLNYIAILFGNFLIYGPWQDPGSHGFPNSRIFPPEALLPPIPLLGGSSGFLIAILVAFGMYFLMNRTTFGFELKVTGDSPPASKYAGISYTKVVSLAMAISGGLCGIAGMAYLSGIIGRMKENFSGGAGYTAIIVAWLAGLNPLLAVLAAFLFGGLLVSGDSLQITLNLSASTVNIFQALILIFVLASDFLKRYHIVMGAKK